MKELEFTTFYNSIWGVVGLIVWTCSFYYFLKRPELLLPSEMVRKPLRIARFIVWSIGACGWLLISYSLTQPRIPQGFAKNKIEVNDIFFVVDVSRSMLADDFKPNRLEVSKDKIKEFVALRPTDRIGIIVFSERAFTLLPLSTDLKLIKQMVGEIDVGGMLGSGTNIGDALGLAVARGAQSLAKNKVIILLTDGVSNVGFLTPLQAAEEARKQGVKIYTVGVGGRGDAKIPYGKNIFGNQRYQNIPGGSIDFENLRKISELTNAKTFEAQNEAGLSEVLSEIEKLEKTEIDASAKVIYKEMYLTFLIPGVLLVLLASLSRKYALKEGGV